MSDKEVASIKDLISKAVDDLKRDYVIIKKSALWYIVGGTIGVLVALGFFTRSAVSDLTNLGMRSQIKANLAESEKLLAKQQSLMQEYGSLELGAVDAWKEVIEVKSGSLIKVIAYTSENEHYQPWEIYFWKPYEGTNAGMYQVPLQEFHEHSKSVEWEILGDGKVRIKKTKFETNRILKISSIEVLNGEKPVVLF